MTPPGAAQKVPAGSPPVYSGPADDKGKNPAKNPPAKTDSFVPAPSKAKSAPSKEDLKNLLPFLGDEQVYGTFLKTVQADKSGKYSKLTAALGAIRKYLKSDGSSAAAKQAVVTYLSDAVLLEDAIATHARKNLIWVLKRADGDPGADEIREALKANYQNVATSPAKPRSKKEMGDALGDANLFGDKLEDYKAGKDNPKKFLKVNLAILAIRKLVSGDGKVDAAKTRVETWLKDTGILQDKTALAARRKLIKELSVPVADASLAADLQAVVESLSSTYDGGVKSPPKPKEALPKVEEKAPETKPEESKPLPPLPVAGTTATFSYSAPKQPGKRNDNSKTIITKVKPILLSTYEAYLKVYPTLDADMEMEFIIDNKNGACVEIKFVDIKVADAAHKEAVQQMLKQIADQMNAQLSQEKQGSEPTSEFHWPKISFKPPAKEPPKADAPK